MKIKKTILFAFLAAYATFSYAVLIHKAVKNLDLEKLKKIVRRANVNEIGGIWRETPLHIAAQKAGHANKEGGTPDYTKRKKAFEIIKLLVSKGANVNKKTKTDKKTTLLLVYPKDPGATEKEKNMRFSVVKYLINQGTDVNAKSLLGTDMLTRAIRNYDPEMAKLLLTNGALVKDKHTKLAQRLGKRLVRKIENRRAKKQKFETWQKKSTKIANI